MIRFIITTIKNNADTMNLEYIFSLEYLILLLKVLIIIALIINKLAINIMSADVFSCKEEMILAYKIAYTMIPTPTTIKALAIFFHNILL